MRELKYIFQFLRPSHLNQKCSILIQLTYQQGHGQAPPIFSDTIQALQSLDILIFVSKQIQTML